MKALLLLSLLLVAGCHQRDVVTCIGGVQYVKTSSSVRAGITVALGRDGKPVPCEEYVK